MSFSPKAIIYLEHKIRAFTPSSRQLASFKKALYAYDLLLLESLQELEAEITSCQLLLTWSFPIRLYEKAKILKYIFTPAAGREWVFQDPRGKVKVYYGDFHGQLISQEIIGMIFYFANNFHQALEAQEKIIWRRNNLVSKKSLSQQKIIFIGYGKIAQACARQLAVFSPEIKALSRKPCLALDSLGTKIFPLAELEAELGLADHVICLLPGGRETEKFFSAKHFQAMKKTAYFYNFGRGTCVDQKALIDALEKKQIAGAGLDVFAKEPLPEGDSLWKMKNCLLTQHSSCFYENYLDLFLEQILRQLSPLNLKLGMKDLS